MEVQTLESLIDRLPAIRRAAEGAREALLANLVMIGEIPAPTFAEAERVRFLQDRFTESGLHCSTDEAGNALAVLNGSGAGADDEGNILLVAHADTVFDRGADHTISVHEDRIVGPGVGDNGLGLAVLATLPSILEGLGIRLRSNLVLMGAVRSLGRGDLGGLRFFLEHSNIPIRGGICVEGVQLGRLSYGSLGMLRGEIRIDVPEEYDWARFGARSAVLALNEVINRILSIPLPRRPRTSILMGQVRGGESFDKLATHAELRFEIQSESARIIPDIRVRIEEIAAELSAETSAEIVFEALAEREPGGVGFGHPLVRQTRRIMEALGVEPRIGPSMSELSMFIHHRIPAVTLGITTGQRSRRLNETIDIAPMYIGLAQLIAVIAALDELEKGEA